MQTNSIVKFYYSQCIREHVASNKDNLTPHSFIHLVYCTGGANLQPASAMRPPGKRHTCYSDLWSHLCTRQWQHWPFKLAEIFDKSQHSIVVIHCLITATHFIYPKGTKARVKLVAGFPWTVTHHSTHRAWRCLASLTKTSYLSQHLATMTAICAFCIHVKHVKHVHWFEKMRLKNNQINLMKYWPHAEKRWP
jgi:hypothetical protein